MFGRRKRERDLEREIQAHLDLEAEEQGDRYAARRAFGNVSSVKEAVREMWGWTSFEELSRNVRQASRGLRKRPVFAAVAILSLAAAIGANTAVFSLARGIVLKTLSAPGADRLVLLQQHNAAFHIDNCCVTYSFFRGLRKSDSDFEDTLAIGSREFTMTADGQTEKLRGEIVSGNYFRMLGVRPALGRLLDESDETSARVCVISYDLWQERFVGRPGVIGQTVKVGDETLQIAGVTMRGFHGASLHYQRDLQVPAWIAEKVIGPGDNVWAFVLARLKPGVRREQAEARLNSIGKQIQQTAGPKMGPHDDFFFRDGSQGVSSQKEQYAKPVLVLFLLVAVVLVVACCNLTALLLVRSAERSREAGMRLAIGASRGALVRQYLTESLMLAAAGGSAGWLVALAGNKILLGMLDPRSTGVTEASRLDWTVFGFCLGVTLAAGLLFGVLPAWRVGCTDPLAAIQGNIGASAPAAKRSYLAGALIAAQIALSLALLFGAGLFTRTLRNLRSIDLGFPAENLALIHLDHSSAPAGSASFYAELLRRTRELPETRAASLSGISALSGGMSSYGLQIPGVPTAPGTRLSAYGNLVSDGYLRTLGIPLLEGRDLTASDDTSEESPVVVNQEFARQFFGGSALGRTFEYARNKARIVGIAGTAKYRYLREQAQPVMYAHFFPKFFPPTLYLQVRSSQRPDITIARIRALVKSIDAGAVIDRTATMAEQIDEGIARERMLALLSTALGGVSVALAGIGLYGVLAFSVTRRTREIGIRMAVGADRRGILALVFKDGVWMVLSGVAAGIPLALGCGRLASSLLYGLKPQDAGTAVAATLVLAIAAAAASLLPAWRAARIDPMAALRNE